MNRNTSNNPRLVTLLLGVCKSLESQEPHLGLTLDNKVVLRAGRWSLRVVVSSPGQKRTKRDSKGKETVGWVPFERGRARCGKIPERHIRRTRSADEAGTKLKR